MTAELRSAAVERARENPPYAVLDPGKATLTGLLQQYAFFSHGAFFTYGGFDCDPLQDYLQTVMPGCTVQMILLARPYLRGVVPDGWQGLPFDHLLFACPHAAWHELGPWLRGVSAADRVRKRFVRATSQVSIGLDLLALERLIVVPATLPTIPITLYGVDATDKHLAFSLRADHTGAIATVRRPINPETLQMGRAILGEDPDQPFWPLEQEPATSRVRGCAAPRLPLPPRRPMLVKPELSCPAPTTPSPNRTPSLPTTA